MELLPSVITCSLKAHLPAMMIKVIRGHPNYDCKQTPISMKKGLPCPLLNAVNGDSRLQALHGARRHGFSSGSSEMKNSKRAHERSNDFTPTSHNAVKPYEFTITSYLGLVSFAKHGHGHRMALEATRFTLAPLETNNSSQTRAEALKRLHVEHGEE